MFVSTYLAMRRILDKMYTFDSREAIINSALSVTLCTQALNILSQSKYRLITQVLPDCKLLRNKVVCHSDFFMHSWYAPSPKIIQKLDFVISVLLILEQQRIERRRIPQEASFPWEGTGHRVSLVSGQRIWACMPLTTPTLYGPFSVYVLLDLKLITNNIIRAYKIY